MDVLLYLSGENLALSKGEANALAETYSTSIKKIYEHNRIYIFSCEKFPFERMASANIMCEFIGYGKDLNELAKKVSCKIDGPFRVTSFSIGNFKDSSLERRFGALIQEYKKIPVSLENYKDEVAILYDKDEKEEVIFFVGIKKEKENFSQRMPAHRPFTVPVTMHPKYARIIVNLARVKENDKVLDPFCGSGAILIEAGLMQTEIFGRDISKYMIEGCKKNLDFFKVKYKPKNFTVGDALNLRRKNFFDAIVTDMPYGRSSYTTNKDIKQLYEKFMVTAYNILKNKKFAVVVSRDGIDYDFYKFKCVEKYYIRVHKSLTRKICVLKKDE